MREEVIGGQRLILGDCLEVLPTLAAGSVDACIVDPPYGLTGQQPDWWKRHGGQQPGKNSKQMAAKREWRYEEWAEIPPPEAVCEALSRIAPVVVMWGANYFADRLPPSSGWLVWDKENDGTDFSDCELAWTNRQVAVRMFRWMWNGCIQRKREERVHPNQKPLPLMQWCIETVRVPENGTVLDCYMGSGTTLVAAELLGRRGIGIEIDPGYFKIACRRVEEAVRKREADAAQLKLTDLPA